MPDASSFDAIQDDEIPDVESAVDWAAAELLRGKSFEKLTSDLLAGGWSPAVAERIVEQARELTRGRRGVHTREEVALDAERRYRRSLRRLRLMIVVAMILLLIILSWMFRK
jgi:hypothetical protein